MVAARLLTIGVLLAACASAATNRPAFRPFHTATVDTLVAGPGELIRELERFTTEAGLEVEVASVTDGFLETRWYHVDRERSGATDVARPERVIRLRFWIDIAGPLGTFLTSEAVHRRVSDPSIPERDAEALVPAGHPGDAILHDILERVRARFGG